MVNVRHPIICPLELQIILNTMVESLLIQTFSGGVTSQAKINKVIALSDGSYVAIGCYGTTGFMHKVSATNVPNYVTSTDIEYRTIVQYDATTIYVIIWNIVANNHFLKPVSMSLVLGAQISVPFNSNYNLQDSIMSSDKLYYDCWNSAWPNSICF